MGTAGANLAADQPCSRIEEPTRNRRCGLGVMAVRYKTDEPVVIRGGDAVSNII
jgi:hypothetical protein